MADFISVPKVSTYNVESSDSGQPFTDEAITIQQASFLYRGIEVGSSSNDTFIGRVGSNAYFVSSNKTRAYAWYSGNNFATIYNCDATNKDGVYSTIIGTIKSWSLSLTNFLSVDEMIERFYAIYIFPVNPPQSGDITVIVDSGSANDDITININAYVDGAENISVVVNAEIIDTNNSGGVSTSSFPQGTFDDSSDVIPVPVLPNISVAQSGLVTLFRPTLQELRDLGAYLWTNISDFIENLNKIFVNPMDYMIALNIFPCVPAVGEPREIKIGSVTANITMSPLISQWFEFDCGIVHIPEYWGSALDYAPNTKISLFLPFIGSVQLNTDEVMGKILGIKYHIDLLSGQCVAMITVAENPTQVGSVYYQYTGECAVSVPLTGSDWSRIYSAAIGAIGTAITGGVAAGASGVAAGGATAALAGARASEAISMAGQNFAMLNETSKGVRGIQEMRARMLEAADIASNAARQAASVPTQVGHAIKSSRIANTINNTVGQVISGKGHISHSGTVSGSAGMLGVKVPYVILEFPNQSLANDYKHFVGYPSNISGKLSDFTGYTECEQIVPVGFTGTDDELAELLDALKGGVYL